MWVVSAPRYAHPEDPMVTIHMASLQTDPLSSGWRKKNITGHVCAVPSLIFISRISSWAQRHWIQNGRQLLWSKINKDPTVISSPRCLFVQQATVIYIEREGTLHHLPPMMLLFVVHFWVSHTKWLTSLNLKFNNRLPSDYCFTISFTINSFKSKLLMHMNLEPADPYRNSLTHCFSC